MWELLGSPVYFTKDRHLPSGELHLIPSSEKDPTARIVELPSPQRRRVRLTMSARERLEIRAGSYDAEVAVVLGRPVVIIKGVFS